MTSPYRLGPVVRRQALGVVREARDLDGTLFHALVIDDEHLGPRTRPAVVEWAKGLAHMKAHARVQHRVDLVDDAPSLMVVFRGVEGSAPPKQLRLDEVDAMIRAVAEGLAHAHAANVAHGALTPSALVCPGGLPIACDFGAQRLAASLHPTQAGGYDTRWLHSLAPEELQTPKAPSAEGDVYALGVLAWEWITGAVPFAHRSGLGAIAQATLTETVPVPEGVHASFLRIPRRMLDKDPKQRPSAAEVLSWLSVEWPPAVPF